MKLQNPCIEVAAHRPEYRSHTQDRGFFPGFGRPHTGAPIERFERAAERLHRNAEQGRSLKYLHPFCPDTPDEVVLSTSRACQEAIDSFRSYDAMRITHMGDLVNAADTLVRMESYALESAEADLQNALVLRRVKYGLSFAAMGVGLLAAKYLLPGILQATLVATGVVGGVSSVVMSDERSLTNLDVSDARLGLALTEVDFQSAQNYSRVAHAWNNYFQKPATH